MNLSQIAREIIAHIDCQFSSYACLVTGSFVDGTYNETYSDIDVLVFVEDRCIGYNEMITLNGVKYQLLIIPMSRVPYLIKNDYTTSLGVYIDMIEKGKIIKDTHSNFLKNLQITVNELYKKGPTKWKEDELYF